MLDTYRHNEQQMHDKDAVTMINTVINDARRLLYKYIYLSLYCKGSKGLFKGCM